MKIGLIAPPWISVLPIGYGGTEEVVDNLARGLRAAGCDVVLFPHRGLHLSRPAALGLRASPGPHGSRPGGSPPPRRRLPGPERLRPAEQRYFADHVQPHVGHQIDHVGEVSPDERVALLRAARAVLFPITWPEPFGLVMVEALACGTPVLGFPNGAAPEIIEDGRTGFLCRDADDMAAAVGRLDTIDRADCRAAVEGYFSSRRMVDDHLRLYHAVLEQRRSRRGGPRRPAALRRRVPLPTG